jgi:hypothetical protein
MIIVQQIREREKEFKMLAAEYTSKGYLFILKGLNQTIKSDEQ